MTRIHDWIIPDDALRWGVLTSWWPLTAAEVALMVGIKLEPWQVDVLGQLRVNRWEAR